MPKHGMTGPVVASGLRAGDRLGLTVEPSHGIPAPHLAGAPRARPVGRAAWPRCQPVSAKRRPGQVLAGAASALIQCLRMIALSVLVLSAGVLSLGLTVAVACRVLPALALTHTVTVIMVRLPAPSGADRCTAWKCPAFWHCQPVPLPPWTIRIPSWVPRVTTMGCALVVAAVPVLVTQIP